ncbi:MAG: type II toxin-antitoxin system RelE/ParE family toxin [Acidobacteriaceae bacterium]
MAQKVRVLWTRVALRHLSEARDFITIDSPAAANRQIQRIEHCVNRLRTFPMMGRKRIRPGTREFAVPATPYLLVYRFREDDLQILAVLHGARNWKRESRSQEE